MLSHIKFTSFPWSVQGTYVKSDIAGVSIPGVRSDEQLIAAAPDLYMFAKEFVRRKGNFEAVDTASMASMAQYALDRADGLRP
jgi:hypothetical protein